MWWPAMSKHRHKAVGVTATVARLATEGREDFEAKFGCITPRAHVDDSCFVPSSNARWRRGPVCVAPVKLIKR